MTGTHEAEPRDGPSLDAGARAGRAVRRLAAAAAPVLLAAVALAAWEAAVHFRQTPPYVLPAPTDIAAKLVGDWPRLSAAWCVTFGGMAAALAAAVTGGVALAVLFTASRWLEASLFPLAVTLQVTPLVAIAPLLLLWMPDQPGRVRLICAWIVAFFPILSNTALGLRSADPGLRDLFRLYGASAWQRVVLLLAPTALPYFLGGLRIATNLALVGAVVAEFVTGAAMDPEGLASIVYEAQYQTDTPLVFSALALVSATGVAMYFGTHLLSRWLLGPWHASEQRRPW